MSNPTRYRLLQIDSEGERELAAFGCLYDACDEAYRRHHPRTVLAVHDSELGERWSYFEMIAGGFSNACTESEWLAARRSLGMSTDRQPHE